MAWKLNQSPATRLQNSSTAWQNKSLQSGSAVNGIVSQGVQGNATARAAGGGNTTFQQVAQTEAQMKAKLKTAQQRLRDATEEEDWLRQRLKAALARAAASDRNRTMLLQQGRDLQNEVASLKQRGRNQTLVAEQELEHAEHAKHVAMREQRYALELQRSAAANQSKLQSALVEAGATSNSARRNETKAKTLVHEVEEQEKQLQAALKNETTWANKTIASMQRAKAVAIAEEQARLQNASVVEEGLREQLAEAHAMTAAAAAKAHKAQQQAEDGS